MSNLDWSVFGFEYKEEAPRQGKSMNSQFAKNHQLIAVKRPEGRACRRIERSGGQVIGVYSEDAIPGTGGAKNVLCTLIALPDGAEIVSLHASETRLPTPDHKLPEGAKEYLIVLPDCVELTWINHPDINKSTLIWATSTNARQAEIYEADWKSNYVDPLGLGDEDGNASIQDLLEGNVE